MADQDGGTISETAAASSLHGDANESITVDQRREEDPGAARGRDPGSEVVQEEEEEERPEGETTTDRPTGVADELKPGEEEHGPRDTLALRKDASQDLTSADRASSSTGAAVRADAQPASSPMQMQKDGSTATPADTESALPSASLRAASIHASSSIHRTASPALSQTSVTSTQGKDSVASPSLTAPKKFSTVNINKKFLGKTAGAAPAGASGAATQAGNKESGLGLVNLSGKIWYLLHRISALNHSRIARPSPTLAQQQSSSSRILTSAKLTSVIPSKTSSVTGGLTAAPAAGWAKPIIPASRSTSIGINGALSPRTATPVNPAEGGSSGTPAARTPAAQSQGLPAPSASPATAAPTAIRLTNQGPSAARHLTSLNPVKQPIKRGWQTISPNPESAQEPAARNEHSLSHGPFGQARFKQSLASDFPTAMEVMEVQRSAVVHAQQAAQAKAAHNQAILEGLNAFRGTNKDPAVHGWDEASVVGVLSLLSTICLSPFLVNRRTTKIWTFLRLWISATVRHIRYQSPTTVTMTPNSFRRTRCSRCTSSMCQRRNGSPQTTLIEVGRQRRRKFPATRSGAYSANQSRQMNTLAQRGRSTMHVPTRWNCRRKGRLRHP